MATTKTWKSKTSTSATWAHSWLNDNSSGNEANVINYSDETNLNYHGAASILEDLLLFSNVTPDGSVKAGGFTGNTTLFSTHGLTFMINGNLKIEDYLTDGVIIKGTTAGFKEGALNEFNDNNYWINGYNGENTDGITYNPSMCIDSSLSWTDDAAYTYASSANSLRRGHGLYAKTK